MIVVAVQKLDAWQMGPTSQFAARGCAKKWRHLACAAFEDANGQPKSKPVKGHVPRERKVHLTLRGLRFRAEMEALLLLLVGCSH